MQSHAELEQENQQIRQTLLAQEADYDAQLEAKDSALRSKDRYIEQLQEALVLARNASFASNSETLRTLQLVLFNEAEQDQSDVEADTTDVCAEAETVTIPAHQRKRGGRKPLPEDLPRIEVIHDLNDEDKICPHDGHELKFISDKVSEQLDIVPMKIQVIRHIRKQYGCPCCQGKGEGLIKTATRPKQAIEKSQASAGLLAYVATAKYADSLPLYRQSIILNRFGIEINRTKLPNWMIKCGQLVPPLINRLEEGLLAQPNIHMNETPVQVLNEAGKSAQSKSYMWVRSGGPPGNKAILFDYDPSRSSKVPKRLLADYHGSMMVDGYAGYDAVCVEQGITRLGCWAHARRKFVEASKAGGKNKKSPKADYAIKLIAKLYAIEKQVKDEPTQVRYQRRQHDSKEVISKLRKWLNETRPQVATKLALGKALYYLDHQWSRLVAYLDDGSYPIDNNAVENAIRPFAIGRKNWLFSSSVRGAKASANLYSLIETAKANGLEPYAYLKQVFTEIPNVSTYDDVDELLPANVNDSVA
jgi:transposase